jgi:hypothetical protein
VPRLSSQFHTLSMYAEHSSRVMTSGITALRRSGVSTVAASSDQSAVALVLRSVRPSNIMHVSTRCQACWACDDEVRSTMVMPISRETAQLTSRES